MAGGAADVGTSRDPGRAQVLDDLVVVHPLPRFLTFLFEQGRGIGIVGRRGRGPCQSGASPPWAGAGGAASVLSSGEIGEVERRSVRRDRASVAPAGLPGDAAALGDSRLDRGQGDLVLDFLDGARGAVVRPGDQLRQRAGTQRGEQLVVVLEPVLGSFGHHLADQRAQRLGSRRSGLARVGGRLGAVPAELVGDVAPRERRRAR